MVASLDFFIAKPDDSVAWLETPEHFENGVAHEDPAPFMTAMKAAGCFVMGSRTYEHAVKLGWPYADVPVIVLTHRRLPAHVQTVALRSGDLSRLVADELRPRYDSIWVVGGAMVATDFIRAQLADDIRITIAPILLGGGTPFVEPTGHEQALRLKNVTAYKSGMVELWYEIVK